MTVAVSAGPHGGGCDGGHSVDHGRHCGRAVAVEMTMMMAVVVAVTVVLVPNGGLAQALCFNLVPG